MATKMTKAKRAKDGISGREEIRESPIQRTPDPSHEQIACRAFQLWVDAGRPEGQQEQHWAQAEAIERQLHH